ncbi:iron-sulfur cluster carrier protein ApbC [Sessilibacter corallicola]|uniref:iron-sulfur cluster carrier protein ApbC n=1 Tax=Sessilibacter corallicola TaxID=2904075 RepID=UPI001E4F47D4|nr:iron-sulfur cluster carrier protein ApbC [Sessilibacter corallicola]MCE2027084.1 iron-sulfur cluster carrier protein ApbC [Sessilibacter corallicola]
MSVEQSVISAVESVIEPVTQKSLAQLNALTSVSIDQSKASVVIILGFVGEDIKQALSQAVWDKVSALDGISEIQLDIDTVVPTGQHVAELPHLAEVKQVIAVASGKGGVGKSTTTANLALALQAEGAKVGILDADIYGPSQPQLFAVSDTRPTAQSNTILPIESNGIKLMSMGFLVTEKTPMVWRGPMASGAFMQILGQTQWGELDYLIVDMPPGTGDIQLTLSQKVPLAGAVIVTTPQDIALLDAKKGIEMFTKVNVPILGVVENMSTHICSSCGHEEPIFGVGGGDRISEQYNTQLLGSLPLSLSIREDADSGKSPLVKDVDSEISQKYRQIAQKASAQLWLNTLDAAQSPVIEFSDD